METDKAIILKKLEDKYGVNTEIKYRLGNKYMSLSMHLESLEYCEKAFLIFSIFCIKAKDNARN
ncbi:hypothetical protein PG911_09350 [Tenacibaculum ovolyticum]|uniref:hypothetical protein n=1 Tax=Tenacibaculum ovolyticum TaxID=104270 RepID=UPI0022F3AE1A|nr:hypothetical protein [Tenacibaculum ovolyticum]WBX74864.1 hypothetical protein PG911_09350 [Tenacibaculum ovolyticum]